MMRHEKLMTADRLRAYAAHKFEGLTHEHIGRKLGLSAGFVGMILSGAREPSKAFLKAIGAERIAFYRITKVKQQ